MTHDTPTRRRPFALPPAALLALTLGLALPQPAVAQESDPVEEAASSGEALFLEAYYQEQALGDPARAEQAYAEVVRTTPDDTDLVARALLGRLRCLRALARDTEADAVLARLEREHGDRDDLLSQARAIPSGDGDSLARAVTALVRAGRTNELFEYGDTIVPHLAAALRADHPSDVTTAADALLRLMPPSLEEIFVTALEDEATRFDHLLARHAARIGPSFAEAALERSDERTRGATLYSLLHAGGSTDWIDAFLLSEPGRWRSALEGQTDHVIRFAARILAQSDDEAARRAALDKLRSWWSRFPSLHAQRALRELLPPTEHVLDDPRVLALVQEHVTPNGKLPHDAGLEFVRRLLELSETRAYALRVLSINSWPWSSTDTLPIETVLRAVETVEAEAVAYRDKNRKGIAAERVWKDVVVRLVDHNEAPPTARQGLRLLRALIAQEADASVSAIRELVTRLPRLDGFSPEIARSAAESIAQSHVGDAMSRLLAGLTGESLLVAYDVGLTAANPQAGVAVVWDLQRRSTSDPDAALTRAAAERVDWRRLVALLEHVHEGFRQQLGRWFVMFDARSRRAFAETLTAETDELDDWLGLYVQVGDPEPAQPLARELGRRGGTEAEQVARVLSYGGPESLAALEAGLRARPDHALAILGRTVVGDGALTQLQLVELYRTAMGILPDDAQQGHPESILQKVSVAHLGDLSRTALDAPQPLVQRIGLAIQQRRVDLETTERVAELAESGNPVVKAAAIETLDALRRERTRQVALEQDRLREQLRERVETLLAGEADQRRAGVAGLVALEGPAAALRLLQLAADDPDARVRDEARNALIALGAAR